MHIVIIGGVAAGASAATKARRVNELAKITLLEMGPYISFANCGLPYYINGVIPTQDKLLVQTPEALAARYNIDVLVEHEAVAVDRRNREVTVIDRTRNATLKISYDKLILAPGAVVMQLPIEGLKSTNIFTLRTVPDAVAIKTFVEHERPKRALVLGAGFIGLEATEVLRSLGLSVVLVEKLPQILTPFDEDMAKYVHDHLAAKGVEVIVNDGIGRIVQNGQGRGITAVLESGKEIPFDIGISALGVRPNTKLAVDAGLEIGPAGAIAVNKWMQTSDPNIYAAGDAVESVHMVTGKPVWNPLARAANLQGRAAGANAAGGSITFKGVLGTAIVKTLDMVAGRTGLNEREARAAGIDYFISVNHASNHAGYYPGAGMLHVKLVAEKRTGRLLGGQIVGGEGVDKRIDVLATAIQAGFTVSDLVDLDLAYSPQVGSAKDAIVVAGMVAENALRGVVDAIDAESLKEKGGAAQIVDVRTPGECRQGVIEGAKEIPLHTLRQCISSLDGGKETVVYCQSGLRSYLASCVLRGRGFRNVRNLSGGYIHCADAVGKRTPAAR
jgi:NADPH-dependent 2,4-dienoyl-CoA reductase/sulfur reductase-like enzyme/rhodanese-related sulfurtransferase